MLLTLLVLARFGNRWRKSRDESILDNKKVEYGAIDYRLRIDSSNSNSGSSKY